MSVKKELPLPSRKLKFGLFTLTPRAFYEARAKALVKELREEKQFTYEQLALALQQYGVRMEVQSLTNRINRGRYSFTFALQVLAAMGVRTIAVPQLPRPEGAPKAAKPVKAPASR